MEIHCQIIAVYSDNVMNEGNFKENIEQLKEQIDRYVKQNLRFTLDELNDKFPVCSWSLLHEIVTVHLNYHKILSNGCQEC